MNVYTPEFVLMMVFAVVVLVLVMGVIWMGEELRRCKEIIDPTDPKTKQRARNMRVRSRLQIITIGVILGAYLWWL